VALNLGKLLKRAFRALRYSSFTVPVAHKSFSIAAARNQTESCLGKSKNKITSLQENSPQQQLTGKV
jgi:hypothetical protein